MLINLPVLRNILKKSNVYRETIEIILRLCLMAVLMFICIVTVGAKSLV